MATVVLTGGVPLDAGVWKFALSLNVCVCETPVTPLRTPSAAFPRVQQG